MPVKRSREASSPAFDDHRFVSSEAAERYFQSVVKKGIISERGIVDSPTAIGHIHSVIQNRHWEVFTAQPEAAVVPIVREFYTNVVERIGTVVRVRGKNVSFDRSTINNVYGLQNIDDDDLARYMQQEVDFDSILQALAPPGAQWKMSGQERITFPAKYLTRVSKAWLYFIDAKFMPTNHHSDVTKDRAALLYAITTGMSIDVGRVIQESIEFTTRAATSGGYGHPSLICALCSRAGVVWGPDGELQHPIGVIDFSMIYRFKQRDAHDLIQSASYQPGGSSSATTSSRQMDQRIDQLRTDFDGFRRTVSQFMQYSIDYNTTWAQIVNRN